MNRAILQALAEGPQVANSLRANDAALDLPPEMRLLKALNSVGAGYGVGRAAGGLASALGRRAPQAAVQAPIHPRELLTDAEQGYKGWESAYKRHMNNFDFQNALRDKWGMLTNTGGN